MARQITPKGSVPSAGRKLLYSIHAGPQYEFMTSDAEEILYGGAAGGGKSYAIRAILVSYCLLHPGATAVLFRRTYKELEDTHILRLKLELPSYIATYKSTSHDFVFANGSTLMMRFCENEEDVRSYDCVGIETPILTDDLRWVPAGELKEGDGILGFEEEQRGFRKKRRLQRATITRQNIVEAPTHRIVLANGKTIDATPEHKWLVNVNSSLIWRSTEDLYRIQNSTDARCTRPLTLRQAVNVVVEDKSYAAGFLSAAFDGEGCLSANEERSTGLELNFIQKENPMLEKVRGLLTDYRTGEYQREGVRVIRSYGTSQNLELLTRLRPPRLLAKWQTLVDNVTIPRIEDVKIVRIEPLVPRLIAEISSSSKTYIAGGFLAHNTFEADIMAFDELTAFSEFQYCVGVDTPILTDDLRWVKAGDLSVGDGLLGFDEEAAGKGTKRKFRKATVTFQDVIDAPTHRIYFADGRTIDATTEHRWLVKGHNGLEWVRTDDLFRTQDDVTLTVRELVPDVQLEESSESGYLAAAFDGEGMLGYTQGLKLCFAQRDNEMLEATRTALQRRGYGYREFDHSSHNDLKTLQLGRTDDVLRFLIRHRPLRLLRRWQECLAERPPHITQQRNNDIRIVKIDPLIMRPIARISSSSQTYIAAGFGAHNTYLLTRCRSTKPWWPGRKIIAATNPGNVGHTWVKRRWIEADDGSVPLPFVKWRAPINQGGMTRQFIPAKLADNTTLMKYDPSYANILSGLPEEEKRAKLMGDWNVFSGQFFSRWRSEVHTCASFDIPRDWLRYISVDWGLAAPHAVYWYARPPMTNSLWIYREQYGSGVPTREQARMAAEKTRVSGEKIEFIVGDPAMWARERDGDGDYMQSPADYWKDEFSGVTEVVKGNNERLAGASLYREMLDWQGVEIPSGIEVLVPPRLRVMRDRAPNFIRTVPQLIHSKTNVEDVDTTGEDHSYDSSRYMFRALFQPPAKPKSRRYFDTGTGIVTVAA